MPKVTRKNAVRRATKTHGFIPSVEEEVEEATIDTLRRSFLPATDIYEKI